MRPAAFVLFLGCCAAVTAAAVLALDLSLERALLLSPLFVLTAGVTAGLVVLWARAARESLGGREGGRPAPRE